MTIVRFPMGDTFPCCFHQRQLTTYKEFRYLHVQLNLAVAYTKGKRQYHSKPDLDNLSYISL